MRVRRDTLGLALGHVHQAAQEAPGGMRVALRPPPRIEECSLAIDGPLQVAPAARALHGGLIDGPGDPGAALAIGPERVRPERRAAALPVPDRLVRDCVASLEQERDDGAEAERVPETPQHGEPDDIRRVLEIVERRAGPLVEAPAACPAVEPRGSRVRCGVAAWSSRSSSSGDRASASPRRVMGEAPRRALRSDRTPHVRFAGRAARPGAGAARRRGGGRHLFGRTPHATLGPPAGRPIAGGLDIDRRRVRHPGLPPRPDGDGGDAGDEPVRRHG